VPAWAENSGARTGDSERTELTRVPAGTGSGPTGAKPRAQSAIRGRKPPASPASAARTGPTKPTRPAASTSPAEPAKPEQLAHICDKHLLDRCHDGDERAWAEVHRRCHSYLLDQIRYSLGDQARDADLVDEIEARVWYNVLCDDRRLLRRYEPHRGNGLDKFLAAFARFEVLRYRRGERRRRQRERDTLLVRHIAQTDDRLRDIHLDMGQFIDLLTRREKQYYTSVLLGNNGVDLHLSALNSWQLRYRIRKKLLKFLE